MRETTAAQGVLMGLGPKQTYAVQNGMSALLPATANADSRKRSCPLYPQKRTYRYFLAVPALIGASLCRRHAFAATLHLARSRKTVGEALNVGDGNAFDGVALAS